MQTLSPLAVDSAGSFAFRQTNGCQQPSCHADPRAQLTRKDRQSVPKHSAIVFGSVDPVLLGTTVVSMNLGSEVSWTKSTLRVVKPTTVPRETPGSKIHTGMRMRVPGG